MAIRCKHVPAWVAMLIILASTPKAEATPSSPPVSALVTETHGVVFKRGFIDWTKDAWADPQPAKLGDELTEGMQIGTGKKSWAQVNWPNVIARAWENSVFAVAPNRKLVYLTSGEMLLRLDKKRKDKDSYYIWTKLLQARIHGTTVLIQTNPGLSRLTVLEGMVSARNRLNGSVYKLKPGAVLEVRTLENTPSSTPISPTSTTMDSSSPLQSVADSVRTLEETGAATENMTDSNNSATTQEQPENNSNTASYSSNYTLWNSAEGKAGGQLINICSNNDSAVTVFQTQKEATNLYNVAVDLIEHPLVTNVNFNKQIDSMHLISNELGHIAASTFDNIHTNAAVINNGLVNSNTSVFQNAEVVSAPTSPYLIGPNAGPKVSTPIADYRPLDNPNLLNHSNLHNLDSVGNVNINNVNTETVATPVYNSITIPVDVKVEPVPAAVNNSP